MHNGCNSNGQTWCEKRASNWSRGTAGQKREEEVRCRGKCEDEEWVAEDRGGVKEDGGVEDGVNLGREEGKIHRGWKGSTDWRQTVQSGCTSTQTYDHTHTRSVSDSTQTNKHQAFQLCMLCSLLPLTLIYTHSLLFHSLSVIHAHSFSHTQFHCADTLRAMLYTACSVELSHKDRTYSK